VLGKPISKLLRPADTLARDFKPPRISTSSREFDRANNKSPPNWSAETGGRLAGQHAWAEAREKSTFPHLEILSIAREKAELWAIRRTL
jgi:hypothetical protein